MRSVSHRRGVTLVEGLVVVAILVLVSTVGVRQFLHFTDDEELSAAAATVRAALEDARARTLASQGGLVYGVRVEGGGLVLFPGATFDAGNAGNEDVSVPASVELISALAGGGSDVSFARLTGAASATGSVTARLKKDMSREKVVTVNATGLVELTE